MTLARLLDTTPPRILSEAAHGSLKPPPTGRLRRVLLHLSHSMTLARLLDTTPPWLLTTAACGGLRSTTDCRSRRAFLHLSYSCIPPCGPAIFVTQDPSATLPANRRLLSSTPLQSAPWEYH